MSMYVRIYLDSHCDISNNKNKMRITLWSMDLYMTETQEINSFFVSVDVL